MGLQRNKGATGTLRSAQKEDIIIKSQCASNNDHKVIYGAWSISWKCSVVHQTTTLIDRRPRWCATYIYFHHSFSWSTSSRLLFCTFGSPFHHSLHMHSNAIRSCSTIARLCGQTVMAVATSNLSARGGVCELRKTGKPCLDTTGAYAN